MRVGAPMWMWIAGVILLGVDSSKTAAFAPPASGRSGTELLLWRRGSKTQFDFEVNGNTNRTETPRSSRPSSSDAEFQFQQELRNVEAAWKDRVQNVTEAFMAFRDEALTTQDLLKAQMKFQEERFRNETQFLRTQVEQLTNADTERRLAALEKERDALESELEELSNRFIQESLDWEDRYEGEQDEQRREMMFLKKELAQIKHEARLNMTVAVKQAKQREEGLLATLTQQLAMKEICLEDCHIALNVTENALLESEARVLQLEKERESVRALTAIAWQLVRERVKKRIASFRGRLSRRKLDDEEMHGSPELDDRH